MDTWIAPREKTNKDKLLPFGIFATLFFASLLPSANYEPTGHSTRKAQTLDAVVVGFRRTVGDLPTPAEDAGLLLAGRLMLLAAVALLVVHVTLTVRRRQTRLATARAFATGQLVAPVYPPPAPEVGRVAHLTIEASVLPGGDVLLHGVDRDGDRLAQGATPEYWLRVAGRDLRRVLGTDDDGLLGLIQANGTRMAERGEANFLAQQGVPFQVQVPRSAA